MSISFLFIIYALWWKICLLCESLSMEIKNIRKQKLSLRVFLCCTEGYNPHTECKQRGRQKEKHTLFIPPKTRIETAVPLLRGL